MQLYSVSQSWSVNMFEGSSEGGGGGDSEGGQSEREVEEGCLVYRRREVGREEGREKERGEERQAKCAQYSFKLTEAVSWFALPTASLSLSLAVFLSFSLSLSLCLSFSLSLSCQTVCSLQQQEEDTGKPPRQEERKRV